MLRWGKRLLGLDVGEVKALSHIRDDILSLNQVDKGLGDEALRYLSTGEPLKVLGRIKAAAPTFSQSALHYGPRSIALLQWESHDRRRVFIQRVAPHYDAAIRLGELLAAMQQTHAPPAWVPPGTPAWVPQVVSFEGQPGQGVDCELVNLHLETPPGQRRVDWWAWLFPRPPPERGVGLPSLRVDVADEAPQPGPAVFAQGTDRALRALEDQLLAAAEMSGGLGGPWATLSADLARRGLDDLAEHAAALADAPSPADLLALRYRCLVHRQAARRVAGGALDDG